MSLRLAARRALVPSACRPVRLLSNPAKEPPRRETLLEKNERLREASEENLERTRQRLLDDASQRNRDMSSLREVIREKSMTIHAPPKALYSQANSFRFPPMETTSLAGETVQLGVGNGGVFSNDRWTVVGCAGSHFGSRFHTVRDE